MTSFAAPAIPWLQPQPLLDQLELGQGFDVAHVLAALHGFAGSRRFRPSWPLAQGLALRGGLIRNSIEL